MSKTEFPQKNKQKLIKSYVIAVVSIAVLLGFDQYTKYLAVVYLKDQPSITIIPGVFQLHYLENFGAAFGLLQGGFVFFVLGATIVTILVLVLYGRLPSTTRFMPLRICSVLLIAGALGNMIDRFVHGFVIDFFFFYLINFPIFNVADVFVVVSCITIAILCIFFYKEAEIDQIVSFNRPKKTKEVE